MAFPHELVVIHDFETYRRGDRITDHAECERVMAGECVHHVHRVFRETPVVAPAPVPAPADK
jgi:hypothetical protein